MPISLMIEMIGKMNHIALVFRPNCLMLGLAWSSQATPIIAVMNFPAFAPVPVAEVFNLLVFIC
jgi:hypothetical protein